jgi:hypothetical protein
MSKWRVDEPKTNQVALVWWDGKIELADYSQKYGWSLREHTDYDGTPWTLPREIRGVIWCSLPEPPDDEENERSKVLAKKAGDLEVADCKRETLDHELKDLGHHVDRVKVDAECSRCGKPLGMYKCGKLRKPGDHLCEVCGDKKSDSGL